MVINMFLYEWIFYVGGFVKIMDLRIIFEGFNRILYLGLWVYILEIYILDYLEKIYNFFSE